MSFLILISDLMVPLIFVFIIFYGYSKKVEIYDVFVEGAKDGLKTVLQILPTLIGLFLAIGALRSSGIIEGIGKVLSPILTIIKFPIEILPLALLRPISRKCINSNSDRHNENIWSR